MHFPEHNFMSLLRLKLHRSRAQVRIPNSDQQTKRLYGCIIFTIVYILVSLLLFSFESKLE